MLTGKLFYLIEIVANDFLTSIGRWAVWDFKKSSAVIPILRACAVGTLPNVCSIVLARLSKSGPLLEFSKDNSNVTPGEKPISS